MPSKSNPIVSSHRDAATRVSKYLREKHSIELPPIAYLEIVARVLGANSWQALNGMALKGRTPRSGDGAVFVGNVDTLPPIGATSVSRVLNDVNLTEVRRGADEGVKSKGSGDLSLERSSSMAPATNVDRLRIELTKRSREYPIANLGDIEPALDRAQRDMKVVLSPTQREAVRQALRSPVSVTSGYPDSGKSLIAEALIRTAEAMGIRKVINDRRGDSMPVTVDDETMPFRAPEYRPLDLGRELSPLAIVRLRPHLAECEMLILDEAVVGDNYLFWHVVAMTPATCRIVILGQIPMEDGSRMSQMLKDLVARNFAPFTQLHETLRQQQVQFVNVADIGKEHLGASHVPDYATGDTQVVSNPRHSVRREEGSSSEAAAVATRTSLPTNAGRYAAKFLPDVRPSQAWHVENFLYSPNAQNFESNEVTGKWCIKCDKDTVDELWQKVCQEIRTYRLFTALVSSPNNARRHGGSYIICVFTPDWADEDDVMRARQVLRELGVTQEIGYKRDIETNNNVYGVPEEWYYRA